MHAQTRTPTRGVYSARRGDARFGILKLKNPSRECNRLRSELTRMELTLAARLALRGADVGSLSTGGISTKRSIEDAAESVEDPVKRARKKFVDTKGINNKSGKFSSSALTP